MEYKNGYVDKDSPMATLALQHSPLRDIGARYDNDAYV